VIRAGVGISTAREPRAAAEEAVAAALAGGLRPDSALLFAGPGFGRELAAVLDASIACLGIEAVVGATAHGVLACGREVENAPAVAVLAQSGLEAHPFLIGDLAGDEAIAGVEIAAQMGGPARPEDLIVLLPDPGALRMEVLLESVRAHLEPARAVGAGAADPMADAPLLWCGRRRERGGLAGMVLRASRPPRIGVTQACRPTTELLRVTRSRGHWILGLDGRPALDVYREVARGPLAEDLRRAAAFLLLAIPRDDSDPLRPGGYVVRHVVGFAEEERAFATPDPVKPGDRIALATREPEAAREDLKAMLELLGGAAPPALGLYFDCCARGSRLFGIPGLESAYIDRAFGAAPIAGLFGSCEIGPIGGTSELLTYTGVLALIDA
jgi:small ligand-binding sensory domain FIST